MRSTRIAASKLMLILGALAAISLGPGCQSSEPRLANPPSTTEARSRTLQQLMTRLENNQKSFRTMTARCNVLLQSPLLPSHANRLELSGELQLLKPRKIRLVLRRMGRVAIRLVGDGENYQVDMPLFNDSYGGHYGDSISGSAKRIHFMPDDLVDALDLQGLFWGKPQMLKAYPRRWEITPGNINSPVIYPPVWHIDSFDITRDPNIGARIESSVLLDRRNEQILRIDKFHNNGDLRVRMWHRNPSLVRGQDSSVRLPGGLIIWYPSPLEGTVINIRFSNRKVNVPVPEERFILGG